MTDKEYDSHFNRVLRLLIDSGEYDNESRWMLETDVRLILQVPHLNPEYFPNVM